jgi:hypothetical protein
MIREKSCDLLREQNHRNNHNDGRPQQHLSYLPPFNAALRGAGTTVYSLLKYFSYLLGHAAGLGQSTCETAPETWALLKRNAWLLPSVERLSGELSRMYERFEEWKSLEVFEPLKQLERTLFADCGIGISDRDGSLYVFVGPGKLPLSL